MSILEKNFLRWFGGIASAVIIIMIVWTITVLSSIDVLAKAIDYNANENEETREFHNSDTDKIGIRFNTFEANQNIMREDIKYILKNMPK